MIRPFSALSIIMGRLPRVVALDTPHHVTQRGNGRRVIFESDSDRLVYLDLLRQHCAVHRLSRAAYCLLSNHVHLIVIPTRADSLFLALKHTHGRYAAYDNARHASSGHVWQRGATIPARSTSRISGRPCDTPSLTPCGLEW